MWKVTLFSRSFVSKNKLMLLVWEMVLNYYSYNGLKHDLVEISLLMSEKIWESPYVLCLC